MTSRHLLVVGTRNRKKLGELLELLGPHGFELRSLDDYPHAIEVDETGDTFTANATLKATLQARHLKHWVLGEDSGLAVDALGGAPGVYSARFSGPDATDARNNEKLLRELATVPDLQRGAHYVCHMTLSDPSGKVWIDCEGTCGGRMRHELAGSGGFGYDPLFEIVEYHRTFGELSAAVKGVISHRARAVRKFVQQLKSLVETVAWDNYQESSTRSR